MYMLRKLRKIIGLLVMTTMLSLGITTPGYAAMLGTDQILAGDAAQQQRDYVRELLNRDDVQEQMISLGVDPEQAKQRVGAMTDQEVQQLAGKLDSMPAGGDAIGVLALVLVVLLITDLLGVTNVYNI
ncbi:MAG: PA2779 family protein [Thiohalophilus sp.]|jgi:hypothetical protein